ncbi:HD-GYP domain-containing protein [Magnetococcus sp. PR-3]|uniref:HD-GYP domain-containing protein n=1 Tax=Magnetococcus sp. PR-3 TaxID=3120355 RepID=UPI002FCE2649
MSQDTVDDTYDLTQEGVESQLLGMVLKEGVFREGEDQHFVPAGTPINTALIRRLCQDEGIEKIQAWSPQQQTLSNTMRNTNTIMKNTHEMCASMVEEQLKSLESDIQEPDAVFDAIKALKKRDAFTFINDLLGDMDGMVNQILKVLDVTTIEGIKHLRGHHESTGNHSIETGLRGMAIARCQGESDSLIQQIGLAGFVHDMGKMFIPLSILDKNGRLTNAEFTHMKRHAALGAEFLAEDGIISKPYAFAAGSHHETFVLKGGYGILTTDSDLVQVDLKGQDRETAWRIGNYLAISDVWTALGEPRAYHKAGKFEIEILMIMVDMMKQGKFDPTLFKEGFYQLYHQRPESKNLLEKGIHFPLFSFPRALQDDLKRRFKLPSHEWKFSEEDLETLGLHKKVLRLGFDEDKIKLHKGITLHELRSRRVAGVPENPKYEGIEPKPVDYRIAFIEQVGTHKVKSMILKIDDTPMDLKAKIEGKKGQSLDKIQNYLFKKVGMFELDLGPYLRCPDDQLLAEFTSGFA